LRLLLYNPKKKHGATKHWQGPMFCHGTPGTYKFFTTYTKSHDCKIVMLLNFKVPDEGREEKGRE